MSAISLDFETFSRADISVGAYKYAEDPSTEVLILAVQVISEPCSEVLTWDVRQPPNEATEILRNAITDGWEIHAFNAQFEWCILKYVCSRQFDMPIPMIEQMRCTAAVCRSAGLPPSLGACAEFLKLDVLKDKVGKKLINIFSCPTKAGDRFTHDTEGEVTVMGERLTYPTAFQKFVDYCAQDVRTEVAVADKMKPHALKGFPLDWFHLDMRVNERGVPVDTVALKEAYRMYSEQEKILVAQFTELTGYTPSQTARVTEWLRERGYKQPQLNKLCKELSKKNDPLTDEARAALKLKSQLDYAAIKKIPAMLNMAMEDGKIRGSFMWCGAQKTWRWTSKTPQWQNMVKPPKWLRPMVEDAYQTVRNENLPLDIFDFVYGHVYHVIASLSRYFVRYESKSMLDLDFASVEARILPFTICAERIMDKIRTGEDIYEATGKSLGAALKGKYNVPFTIDRDMAKTIVLATQFQGGHTAVFNATGQTWERAWCDTAVQIVRTENPEFPVAWKLFQETFIAAFKNPLKWHEVTPYVSFAYVTTGPFPRMLMRLASGRYITYPHPACAPITMAKVVKTKAKTATWVRVAGHMDDADEIARHAKVKTGEELDNWFHTYELSFYGHVKGKTYGRVNTYGGDLLQSATQGAGADLLAHGALKAEEAGFEPFFLVHDQCLAPETGKAEDFQRAMCSVPEWFEGFPLDADADVVRSYCKA